MSLEKQQEMGTGLLNHISSNSYTTGSITVTPGSITGVKYAEEYYNPSYELASLRKDMDDLKKKYDELYNIVNAQRIIYGESDNS